MKQNSDQHILSETKIIQENINTPTKKLVRNTYLITYSVVLVCKKTNRQ